jgi:hypothetical protein
MPGNPWVGQHVGREDPRITRISPFFYGQHKLMNIWYIPKLRDLPQDGMDLKGMVFDFGFNAGNPTLGPFATGKVNLQVERPFMIWGITGFTNDLSAPRVGYNLQIFHTHDNDERQFFNKSVNDGEIAGSGRLLHILRSPYLVIRGDQLACEVKNLSSNSANPGFPASPASDAKVQVVLLGGEFD